jgi:hypothetical protein
VGVSSKGLASLTGKAMRLACRGVPLVLILVAGSAAQILPGWLHKASDFRTFGQITAFHLDAPLTSPPLASLADFPVKNFTYALYATAESGAGGMVPGNTQSGTPLMIPVARGLYDHETNTADPMEFQIIKADPAALPKAPGKSALLVYGVLYTGDQLANCTGVVQVIELNHGKLILADQFSYDCAGGAGAEWNQSKHVLTLRAAKYVPGDKPCCPTSYDFVDFKLDGDSIKIGDMSVDLR